MKTTIDTRDLARLLSVATEAVLETTMKEAERQGHTASQERYALRHVIATASALSNAALAAIPEAEAREDVWHNMSAGLAKAVEDPHQAFDAHQMDLASEERSQ